MAASAVDSAGRRLGALRLKDKTVVVEGHVIVIGEVNSSAASRMGTPNR